jgi:hypothetical protein
MLLKMLSPMTAMVCGIGVDVKTSEQLALGDSKTAVGIGACSRARSATLDDT